VFNITTDDRIIFFIIILKLLI